MISEGEGGHEAELSNTINIKRTDVLAGDSPPPSPASGCILATPSTCSFPFLLLAPLKKEKKRKKERKDPATSAQRCVDSKHMCYISPAWEKPPPRSSSSFLSLSCYWEKYVEQFLCLLSFSSFATLKTYWTQLTAFGVSFIYSDGNIRD